MEGGEGHEEARNQLPVAERMRGRFVTTILEGELKDFQETSRNEEEKHGHMGTGKQLLRMRSGGFLAGVLEGEMRVLVHIKPKEGKEEGRGHTQENREAVGEGVQAEGFLVQFWRGNCRVTYHITFYEGKAY